MTAVDEIMHADQPSGTPVLEATGVTMRFGGLTAVNDVAMRSTRARSSD